MGKREFMVMELAAVTSQVGVKMYTEIVKETGSFKYVRFRFSNDE